MNTEYLPQTELDLTAAPQQVPLVEIEQVIERISASYSAEVRALWEELRQRVQAMEHETVDVLPSERAQPQDIRPAQTKNASTGSRSGAAATTLAEAPPSHSAQAPQHQIAQFPESVARPQAQPWRRKRRDVMAATSYT